MKNKPFSSFIITVTVIFTIPSMFYGQPEGKKNDKTPNLGQIINKIIKNTTPSSTGKAIYKLSEEFKGEKPRLSKCKYVFDGSLYSFSIETLESGGEGLGPLDMVRIFDGEKSISYYPKEKKADFRKGRHNIPIYDIERFMPTEILNKLLKHDTDIKGYDRFNNIDCIVLHCSVASNESVDVWVTDSPDIFPLKIEQYKSGNLQMLYEFENIKKWNEKLFPEKIKYYSYYKYNDSGIAEGISKKAITLEDFQPDIEIARSEFIFNLPPGIVLSNIDKQPVTLDSVLKLWSEGKKEQAVESFINLDWDSSAIKTQNDLLNMPEKQFASLTLDDQAVIRRKSFAFTFEIRDLVKSVVLEAQKSIKDKKDADAEKGLKATLKFGEYLSNLDTLSAIKMTGNAVKKIALNELMNFYTQTNQQEKLKTITTVPLIFKRIIIT